MWDVEGISIFGTLPYCCFSLCPPLASMFFPKGVRENLTFNLRGLVREKPVSREGKQPKKQGKKFCRLERRKRKKFGKNLKILAVFGGNRSLRA